MQKKLQIASTIMVLLVAGCSAAYAQCPLPNQLQTGDVADGAKVTANFSALANCADDQGPAGAVNAIQYNAGNASLGAVAPLADGQTVIGSTGNAPQGGSITSGSGIAILNGPASLTVTATGSGTGSSVDWLNKAAVIKPDEATFTMQTSTTPPTGANLAATARGILLTASAVANNQAIMAEVAVPGGNWQATMLSVYTGPLSNYIEPSITVRDATSNRAVSFSLGGNGDSYRFDYIHTTGGIGLDANAGDASFQNVGFSTPTEPIWSRLTYNGSTFVWSFSRDGEHFTPAYTVSSTEYLTNLSDVGPAVFFYQPTHPTWNVGYHILSWNLISL